MQATPCKDCGAPFECELTQRDRVELRWTCGRSVVVTPPGYVSVRECGKTSGRTRMPLWKRERLVNYVPPKDT